MSTSRSFWIVALGRALLAFGAAVLLVGPTLFSIPQFELVNAHRSLRGFMLGRRNNGFSALKSSFDLLCKTGDSVRNIREVLLLGHRGICCDSCGFGVEA